MDEIEVQGFSAQTQQNVIQGDQDKIIQHEYEVYTGPQGVSVKMPQSVIQGDNYKILHWGVQGDGKSMNGDGLDALQWVQCQMKQSLLKGMGYRP